MTYPNQRRGAHPFVHRRVVLLLFLPIAAGASARHPLEPLDTSNPRTTFKSFLDVTEIVTRRYREYRDSPSPATMAALFDLRYRYYSRLLDLSQVRAAARGEVSAETFLLLWEVIARLELPKLEAIPDGSPGADRG